MTPHVRRWVVVAVALVAVSSLVVGLAAAQPENTTTTTTPTPNATTTPSEPAEGDWNPPGPYRLDTLTTGGTQLTGDDVPPSARYIREDGVIDGAIALQHTPTNPLESRDYLEPGTRIETNTLEVFTSIFGTDDIEYELVIVYWQEATITTENGTQRTYAANQSVQRVALEPDAGMVSTEVALTPHYDQLHQLSIWLEDDGQPVPGVRWSSYTHLSTPGGQAIPFSSLVGALWFAAKWGVLSGMGWATLGLGLAYYSNKRAGSPPRLGIAVWGFLAFIASMLILGAAWYQLAVLLTTFKLLLGSPLFFVGFGGGMMLHNEVETWGFERTEMQDAKALRQHEQVRDHTSTAEGDEVTIDASEYKESLYEDLIQKPTVLDTTGTRKVPVAGIRPWLARLFASAATIPNQFTTEVSVRKGELSKKVYLDPEDTDPDDPVPHQRAHFTRRMPIWHRLDDDADTIDKILLGVLTIGFIAGLPYVGYQLGATMNIPLVGLAATLPILLVESYEARDGWIEIREAPIHDRSVKKTLQVLQREHSDAKYMEEVEAENDRLRMQNAKDLREQDTRRSSNLLISMLADEMDVPAGYLSGHEDDGDPLDLGVLDDIIENAEQDEEEGEVTPADD